VTFRAEQEELRREKQGRSGIPVRRSCPFGVSLEDY